MRERFGKTAEADLKRRFDPVTEADHESERVITEILRAERPDHGILAEEGGGADGGVRWIVDPLDSTVNFVHGIPQLGVAVALYDEDEPLLAVTIDVIRGEEFVATAGGGATLNGRRITVSDRTDPATAVLGTGFPYDHDQRADQLAGTIGAMLRHVNGLRSARQQRRKNPSRRTACAQH